VIGSGAKDARRFTDEPGDRMQRPSMAGGERVVVLEYAARRRSGDERTACRTAAPDVRSIGARVDEHDWPELSQHLDAHGYAILPKLLSESETAALVASYDEPRTFRSRIVMAQHGFGRGEYKYFAYPLPGIVAGLRSSLYRRLVPVANRWNGLMGIDLRFPETHDEFRRVCHEAGQLRPTPLLLQYTEGDFNALHQDVYGDHVFPLQAAILLSAPGADFTGGEFVLVEQRPRMQSRAEVVPLGRGDCVVWAVRHRHVRGTRGTYRVSMRHGVSRVRSGRRHTLGVIFHDAT